MIDETVDCKERGWKEGVRGYTGYEPFERGHNPGCSPHAAQAFDPNVHRQMNGSPAKIQSLKRGEDTHPGARLVQAWRRDQLRR